MRSLLIIIAVVGSVVARPGHLGLGLGVGSLLGAPLAYSNIGVPAPIVAPVSVSSQYHAQDELGQYSYGYAGAHSVKNELKTFDGVTRGGYSYVDPAGKLQTVNYVSDAVNGFRVAATNLPVAPEPVPSEPLISPTPVEDTAEVMAAREAHLAAVVEAKTAAEAAPEVPEPIVDAVPASVTIAGADLLPASVLSRTVIGAVPAPLPVVAPSLYPVSNFGYSVSPALTSIAPFAINTAAPAWPLLE